MLGNEICHAGHAAVAQLHVVVFADLVQSMSGWKVHRAPSYSGVAFANSSWLRDKLERRFASIIGNCFLIMGWWLD